MPLPHYPSSKYTVSSNNILLYYFIGNKKNFTFNKPYKISSVQMPNKNGRVYCNYYSVKNDIGKEVKFEYIDFDQMFLSGIKYKEYLEVERNSKIESLLENNI